MSTFHSLLLLAGRLAAVFAVMAVTACGSGQPPVVAPAATPSPAPSAAATQVASAPTAAPTASATATALPTATATAAQAPTPFRLPPTTTPTPMSGREAELNAYVTSVVPADWFDGLRVLPLLSTDSRRPYWLVHSTGHVNFKLRPLPSHFAAVYTHDGTAFKELARVNLDEGEARPDIILSASQVDLAPSRLWVAVDGGAGAHSGTFQILSFDGSQLRIDMNVGNSFPGVGTLEDIDGDGSPEVIIDGSDAYVFCYACGIRYFHYTAYRWNEAEARFTEATLMPLPAVRDNSPAYADTNAAVSLAKGGLWRQAMERIAKAKTAAAGGNAADLAIVNLDYGLIELHAQAFAGQLKHDSYPVLAHVFYGDYAAAVELMRPYAPPELFKPDSPLIVGTAAEAWVENLTTYVVQSATAAIAADPTLAPAYFMRGWAKYLVDPADASAKADVAKAAELAPGDPLLTASAKALP